MEDSKPKKENHSEELENTNIDSGKSTVDNGNPSNNSGKPSPGSGTTEEKPTEDILAKNSQPPAVKSNKRIPPLSIRTDQSTKYLFQELSHSYGGTHEEFLQKLINVYQNPPETQVETVEKEIEVIKEIEKELPEHSILVQLDDKEFSLMEIVSDFRFKKGLGVRSPGEGITRESKSDILRKSFFNKHRLRDIDGEFYTGLTKEHFKK